MVALVKSKDVQKNSNLSNNGKATIRIGRKENSLAAMVKWEGSQIIKWSSYEIRETDMRIKTASFTTPQKMDLTTGQWMVLITHPGHESFAGIILSREYDTDTGLSTYQCQDFSRHYQSKIDLVATNMPIYNFLRSLMTKFELPGFPTSKKLKEYSRWLSGLRPLNAYNQELYGSVVKFNPFRGNVSMIIQGKTWIEAIRDIVYGTGGYIDVYIDIYGIIHVQPYHKKDLFESGLHLTTPEIASRKYKFDTTNIVTGVAIKSNDKGKIGEQYQSKSLVNLDLTAFFGYNNTLIDNPNKSTTKTNNASSGKQSTTSKNTSNPYGNKAKKIWIDADNGSGGMKDKLASALRKHGWTVHVGATNPNAHYEDYFNVSSDYQVLMNVYNGFCAGTIQEAYSSTIQNRLKNKGVVLVIVFESGGWTNPQGMKPYRYGDFSGYTARRAWDDNFSSSDPTIRNVGDFFKKNNAKYCCGPDVDSIMAQFLAGGYFAYKNK